MQIPGVPESLLEALVAAAQGRRLALVGGAVRDLLLHRRHQDPWRGLPDLDLVFEGRAFDLIEPLKVELSKTWGTSFSLSARVHGRYQTVELRLELPSETWLLDLASARREIYAKPAWNPCVELGSLEDDLVRRDFTVNAMALDLQSGNFLDPFGGQEDLAGRQLRFLHANSFRDDPSRLIRAARYAARLNFEMSSESLWQVTEGLQAWPWPWKPMNAPEAAPPALAVRLRRELELLLEKEPWPEALEFLQHCGGLRLLDQSIQEDPKWHQRLLLAEHYQLPRLLSLIAVSNQAAELAQRLKIPQSQQKLLEQMLQFRRRVQHFRMHHSAISQPPSVWCQLFEEPVMNPPAVALAYVTGSEPSQTMLRWLETWQYVRSPENGAELCREGWSPGKALGEELKRRRMHALDQLPGLPHAEFNDESMES